MGLYSFSGFSLRVCELSRERTRKEAYQIAETEHEELFGERKYSGYQSFKSLQYYYRNKVRK